MGVFLQVSPGPRISPALEVVPDFLSLCLAGVREGREGVCLPTGVSGIDEDTSVPSPQRPSPSSPLPRQGPGGGLTVDDEVDLSGVRLVAGLEGAGVEALVPQPHLGDEDGELLGRVGEQPHPRVAGPAVVARVQDVGAVQPGHSGHMLVNEAAGGEDEGRAVLSPTPAWPSRVTPHRGGLEVGRGRLAASPVPRAALGGRCDCAHFTGG